MHYNHYNSEPDCPLLVSENHILHTYARQQSARSKMYEKIV